jgi:predicted nucleic acid-binding protein
MKHYVVDASVILKWVVGDEREKDQRDALNLLHDWVNGRVAVSAPPLWQYEVGNFLGREVPEEAEKKMKLLLNLHIRKVELSDTMYQQCFAWMRDSKITFYDASYLAVAHEIGAVLLTADAQFAAKMDKNGPICLLKNLHQAI